MLQKKFLFSFIFLLIGFSKAVGQVQSLEPIPAQYSLAQNMPPIKDQMDRYSCGSFTFLACLEYEIWKKYGVMPNLSEEYLHGLAAELNTGFSTIASCARVVKYKGVLLEQDWPYQSSYFAKGQPCAEFVVGSEKTPSICITHFQPPSKILEKKLNIDLKVMAVRGIKSICRIMFTNQTPIMMWFPLEIIESAEKTGKITIDTSNFQLNEKMSGHFMAIEGYDLDKQLFQVRNSFGKEWGNHGHATISFDYFSKFESMYGTYIILDAVDGLKNITQYEPDSVYLRNANVHAVLQSDSSLLVQLTGNKPVNMHNQFRVKCSIVSQSKSNAANPFEQLRLQGAELLNSKDSVVGESRYSNLNFDTLQFLNPNTTFQFNLCIPKNHLYVKALYESLRKKNQNLFLSTKIYWQTDTFGEEYYQEIMVPLSRKFFHFSE